VISDSTAATEAGSSAAVGSSSSSTFGRTTSARMSASRSRSPVDRRVIGQAFASSGNPRSLTNATAAAHSLKCSPTVSAHQPGSAGTYPTKRRHSGAAMVERSRPFMHTRPSLGSRSAMARSSKVLPAPEGPRNAMHSPAHNESEAGLRTFVRRSRT